MSATSPIEATSSRVPPWTARAWVLCATVVGLAMLLVPAAPPPSGDQVPAEAFSGARARELLDDLASEPHPLGSEAGRRARAVITGHLEQLGLPFEELSWTLPDVDQGRFGPGRGQRASEARSTPERRGTNVLARRVGTPGSETRPVALFMVHHDSRRGAPGAGDDGAGVVGLLETLRVLSLEPAATNELWFLFTDGEEAGLLGAEAFAQDSALLERVAVVVNFEGRGNAGPSILFETGRDDAALIDLVAGAVSWPVASSLGPTVYERLPNDTDLSVFKRRGLCGLNFAFVGGGSAYHRPWDTPANLDPRSLEHQGRLALELARALGDADLELLTRVGGGRATFFTLPGNVFVHYPGALDPWVTLLALGLCAATLASALRRGTLRAGGLFLGLLAWPTFAALFAGVVMLIRWLLGRATALVADSSGLMHEPRGNGASCQLEVLGLAALAAFLTIAVCTRVRPSWLDTLVSGALFGLGLVCALLTLVAPGASHVLSWPLAFFALATHVSLRLRAEGWSSSRAWLMFALALPPLAIVLPVAQLLAQVGSVHPLGAALATSCVLALFVTGFLPQVERMTHGAARLALTLSGLIAAGSLVLAAWLAFSGR